MTHIKPRYRDSVSGGFALLFSLLTVSVMLAIGLTILDFTIKQVTLSGVTRDSERAFHAANAGFECVRKYVRDIRDSSGDPFTVFLSGSSITCLGNPQNPSSINSNGDITSFIYEFDWSPEGGSGVPRCTEIEVYVVDATAAPVGWNIMNTATPSYFPDEDDDCVQGQGYCYLVASRGLNRTCSDTSTASVQREVFGRL